MSMYSQPTKEQQEAIDNKTKTVGAMATSKLQMLQRGSVTEITMGDKTFQVTDPKKIEQTITVLKTHDEAIFTLRQRVKEQTSVINQLLQDVNTLKNEVQRLKEITNGYGSQEFSNY